MPPANSRSTCWERDQQGALGLWENLPDEIKEKAIFYTDDWKAYRKVLPTDRHVITEQKKEKRHGAQSYRTLFLYLEAESQQDGEKKLVFFQKKSDMSMF